jgi:P27 family predicted phage terminase small subunit
MPKHLDEEARREWRRLVRILTRMRVLTEADGIALATLCQAYSTLAKAQAQLSKTGIIFKTPNGYVQQNPLLKVVNQQAEIIIRHPREFGLTPASRSRLTAEEPVPDDTELFRLLSAPRPPRQPPAPPVN